MNIKPFPQGYNSTHLGLAIEPFREGPVSRDGYVEYTLAAAAGGCQHMMVEGQKTLARGATGKPVHTEASEAYLGGHSRGGRVHAIEPPDHLKNPDGSFNLTMAGLSLSLEEMDPQVPLTSVMNLKPAEARMPGTEYDYKNTEDAGKARKKADFSKGLN